MAWREGQRPAGHGIAAPGDRPSSIAWMRFCAKGMRIQGRPFRVAAEAALPIRRRWTPYGRTGYRRILDFECLSRPAPPLPFVIAEKIDAPRHVEREICCQGCAVVLCLFPVAAVLKEKTELSGSVDVIPRAAPRARSIGAENAAPAGRRGRRKLILPASRLQPSDKSRFTVKDGRNWNELEALFGALEAPGRVLDVHMTRLGNRGAGSDGGRRGSQARRPRRPEKRPAENGAAKA